MKKTAEELIKRSTKAQDEHFRFKQMYEEVFKFGMPNRYQTITDVETKGSKNREEINCSVFELACDEFVQRFQSLVAPVNTNWIDFEAGYLYQDKKDGLSDVNRTLNQIANILNVYKNTSNFDTAFTEMCYDIIAGTGCLSVLEGTPDEPFRFSAIPFTDIMMVEGINGMIDQYYRKLNIRNDLVSRQWAGCNFEYEQNKDDECADLLECTYYDKDIDAWHYCVIDKKKSKFIVERIYITSPFIDLRWSKCAGETYGRGCGLKVISDVKTLNRIKEYSLRALAFSVPAFTVSTDAGYNPNKVKLFPAALIPVPSNASNNPTIKQLEVNPMPDLRNYNVEQLEMEIKRGMFASTIPNDPNPKMTATEVAQRVNELDNSLSNSFGRLLEFLNRLTRRMVEVAQRFGFIQNDIDVRSFNGYGFKVKVNTQLANQQTKKEVSDILQAMQVIAQFDPTFSLGVVKMEELAPYVLQKMGIPADYLRSPEEIRTFQEQNAQAMQQQQRDLAQLDVDVDNAKAKGKADAERGFI